MGYHTDFSGEFTLDKPLAPHHKRYLEKFAATRRMKRGPATAAILPDPLREAVGLPIGEDGAYFVGGERYGMAMDKSVSCANTPPGQLVGYDHYAENKRRSEAGECQPGLWCQWIPNEDGTAIEWDGGEKFYNYVDWIRYLVAHFLKPWGYVLNGEVIWSGSAYNDLGLIRIVDNAVHELAGQITYQEN